MMRRMVLASALALIAATPAAAQLDPLSYGEAAASIGRTQVMNEAITQQNASRNAAATRQRARATCARKDALAARHGNDDPRVKKLFSLCAQAGY